MADDLSTKGIYENRKVVALALNFAASTTYTSEQESCLIVSQNRAFLILLTFLIRSLR